MICPNCHAEIPDNCRFCTECGARLEPVRRAAPVEARAVSNTGLLLGQAARRARLEAPFDPAEEISARAYNAVMIGVLLWGLLINVLLCTVAAEAVSRLNPVAVSILYLICAIAGILIAGRSHNPFVSFLGYNLVVIPLGLVISLLVQEYGGIESRVVRNAFFYTLLITTGMLGLQMIIPTFFENIGRAILGFLIALILSELLLFFLRIPQGVTDWLAAGLFSLYVAYDIHRSQQFPRTLDNAVDCALDIYLDLANLFLRLLQIFGRKRDD